MEPQPLGGAGPFYPMPQNKRRRPPGRRLRRSSSGVSGVLGSIMLVGITVAVFAMLSFIPWAALKPPSSLHADIAVTVQGGKVVLVHQGGQTLDATASRLRSGEHTSELQSPY